MIEKAQYELDLLLKSCGEDNEAIEMQKVINENIMAIVKVFANQGHSGSTAEYTIHMVTKLLKQTFIMPLTGEDDEWDEIATGVYQNKRESRIFKQSNRFDGKPYTLEGKIFSRDGGQSWFTNRNSMTPVEFPLKVHPEPERVILSEEEADE